MGEHCRNDGAEMQPTGACNEGDGEGEQRIFTCSKCGSEQRRSATGHEQIFDAIRIMVSRLVGLGVEEQTAKDIAGEVYLLNESLPRLFADPVVETMGYCAGIRECISLRRRLDKGWHGPHYSRLHDALRLLT